MVREPAARWVKSILRAPMQYEPLVGGIEVRVETTSVLQVARFVVTLGDAVAEVLAADGQPQVTCIPTDLPGLPAIVEDPCAGAACGAGTCHARGARAHCLCNPGAVGILTSEGPTCVAADPDAPTYGPGGGPESRAVLSRAALGPSLLVSAGLLLLLTLRRRR